MRAYFSQYGRLVTCRIVYNQDSNVSRGFGFVIYQDKEAADRVVQDREHHYLHGKWVDCKSALLRQEMNPMPSEAGSIRSGGKSNATGHDRARKNGHSGSDKSSKGGNKNRKYNLAKNNFENTPQLTASSIYSGQGNSFAQMSYARAPPVAASPASHAHGTRNQLHNSQYNQNPNTKNKAMTPGVRNTRNFGQYSAPFQGNNQQYHQIISSVEMDDDMMGSPQHGGQYLDSLESPIPTPVSRGGFRAAFNRTVDKYYKDSQNNQGFPVPVMEDDEFSPESHPHSIRAPENKPKLMLPVFDDDDMPASPLQQQPTYIAPSPKVLMEPQQHQQMRQSLEPNHIVKDIQPSPRRMMGSYSQGLPQVFVAESYDQREERDDRQVSKHMLPFLIESDEIPQMTINSMKKKSHHSSSGSHAALNPKQKNSQRGSESPMSIHYDQGRAHQPANFNINSDMNPIVNSQMGGHMNYQGFGQQPRQQNIMLSFNPEEDIPADGYDVDIQGRSSMSRFNTHLGGFWTPQGQTPTNGLAQAVEYQQPSTITNPQFTMMNMQANQRYSSPKTVPNSHAPMSKALGFSTYMERVTHTRPSPHEG